MARIHESLVPKLAGSWIVIVGSLKSNDPQCQMIAEGMAVRLSNICLMIYCSALLLGGLSFWESLTCWWLSQFISRQCWRSF